MKSSYVLLMSGIILLSSCHTTRKTQQRHASLRKTTHTIPSKKDTTKSMSSTSKITTTTTYKTSGIASYYHNKFNGRKTANGEVFSNNKLTAAHRTYPFGTLLKVTNPINGKSVVVKVNDRGPFTAGKELDLSRKAFMQITDNPNKGNLQVNIEIVSK